jgi:ABC-2 type transport system permease protein
MGKIGLIIKREFSTRIRKKTFIVLTLLGPLLFGALLVAPAYLATLPGDVKVITVLDESLLLEMDKGNEELKLRYLPPNQFNRQQALKFSQQQSDYAFLYVPSSSGGDPDWLARNIKLYRAGDVSLSTQSYLEKRLEKYLQREKLKASGVDPQVVARSKTNVSLRTINTESGTETNNATILKMGIGYAAAFLIYFYVFLYGGQVLRGVIEEKTSRIVEVIISSVKPLELMVGKIVGIALLALVQFVFWLVFGALFYFLAITFILGDALDPEKIAAGGQMANNLTLDIFKSLSTLNFPLLIGAFLFYFLAGYLLYASLFAGLASVVDKESDAGQFTLPVTLPLILAIIVLLPAVDNPDGAVAFWFSLLPFTSPVIMLARIPFGVPAWQLLLSMSLLLLSIGLALWAAAKIYRTAILMYGKKPTFTELFKWLRHKTQ